MIPGLRSRRSLYPGLNSAAAQRLVCGFHNRKTLTHFAAAALIRAVTEGSVRDLFLRRVSRLVLNGFAARDAHQRSPNAKVEIVYWRGRQRMTAIIPPGRMRIKFNQYNPANYQLDSLMQKLNMLIEAPSFSEGGLPPTALPPRDKL